MNSEQGNPKEEVGRIGKRCLPHHYFLGHSLLVIGNSFAFLLLLVSLNVGAPEAQAAGVADLQNSPQLESAQVALANNFARLIEAAIPREYEKRKDWGRTKNLTVGIRNDGFKIYRRKKPVNHGTWKHYTIRLIEPERTLGVQIENLRAIEGGRVGFTLKLSAQLDLWARVKIYNYGIHLIALETVGDAAIDLAIDCEIGIHLQTSHGKPGLAIDPSVTDARLDITDLNIQRVSNAKGPIVREIGEELPRWIEHELQGPKLVGKLNRAIDKKRDRLELNLSDVLKVASQSSDGKEQGL